MIVFVYDTMRSNIEELDPVESVMYFYPAWVSPVQKLALAGQLMGIVQFMMATYSAPYLVSLQGGKFALKKCGQYVLVSLIHTRFLEEDFNMILKDSLLRSNLTGYKSWEF